MHLLSRILCFVVISSPLLIGSKPLPHGSVTEDDHYPWKNSTCTSQNITFDPSRFNTLGQGNDDYRVPDNELYLYDMTVDYGIQNIESSENGIKLFLTKNEDGSGSGPRLSSTHYFLYGKVTARVKAAPYSGIITAFILLSDEGDEIDFEFVGNESYQVQTNLFYRGILEYGIRGRNHTVSDTAEWHDYTIDWRPDVINFLIDGIVVRSYYKNSSEAQTAKTPDGQRSFPNTPSRVQISVWDAGSSADKGTSKWAGGPIQWGNQTNFTAQFHHLHIECYNHTRSHKHNSTNYGNGSWFNDTKPWIATATEDEDCEEDLPTPSPTLSLSDTASTLVTPASISLDLGDVTTSKEDFFTSAEYKTYWSSQVSATPSKYYDYPSETLTGDSIIFSTAISPLPTLPIPQATPPVEPYSTAIYPLSTYTTPSVSTTATASVIYPSVLPELELIVSATIPSVSITDNLVLVFSILISSLLCYLF